MSYQAKKSKVKELPERKKSIGEQVREDMIFMLVFSITLYLILGFFKLLLMPFRVIFKTDEQLLQDDIENKKLRISKRNIQRYDFKKDPDNPFNQYMERFKLHPEHYVGDPDNELYQQWYDSWKNGTNLDSSLLWAPEVYTLDPAGDKMFNAEFVDYLSMQTELHNTASFSNRWRFIKTIRELYPEFTPRIGHLKSEIKEIRERINNRNLKYELIDEMTGRGIALPTAEDMVENGTSAKKIAKAADITAECNKYGDFPMLNSFLIKRQLSLNDLIFTILENDINENANNFKTIHELIDDYNKGIPSTVFDEETGKEEVLDEDELQTLLQHFETMKSNFLPIIEKLLRFSMCDDVVMFLVHGELDLEEVNSIISSVKPDDDAEDQAEYIKNAATNAVRDKCFLRS